MSKSDLQGSLFETEEAATPIKTPRRSGNGLKCTNDTCPLFGKIEVPFVSQKGAKILFFGESPGRNEEKEGRPFIGRAGQLLHNARIKAKVKSPWACANSARCLIDKKNLTNKEITATLANCRHFGEDFIYRLKPKIIVILGDFALRQILKTSGITKKRGRLTWSDEFQTWALPMFHPAYILRNPEKQPFFDEDMRLLQSFEEQGFERKVEKNKPLNYRITESIRPVLDLAKDKVLRHGFDTETHTLDYMHPDAFVISYSLGLSASKGLQVFLYERCKRSEADFIVEVPGDRKKETIKVGVHKAENFDRKIQELVEYWENPHILKYMQNGNFDLHQLTALFHKLNMPAPKFKGYVMDVQAGAHCINSDLYKQVDLDQLRRSFTSREAEWKDDFAKKHNKKAMILVPKEDLTDYAVEDSVCTRDVGLELRRRIKKDPALENYFRRAVMPILTRALFVMEENGFHVDTKALEETKKSFARHTEEYHQKAIKLIPMAVRQEHAKAGLKLTRSKLLADTLYSENGFNIDIPRKTKGGEPSTDKTARTLVREDPDSSKKTLAFLDEYDEWMMWHGLLTHSLPQLSEFTKSDGRIHGQFSLTASVTGRVASSRPNLMNIPKRSKAAPEINRLITPQKPGWCLIEADFAQSELRWLSHLSQDKELLRVYRAGEDIHQNTAKILTKGHWADMTKEEQKTARTKSKSANFGIVYGASPKGFMRYCKVEFGLKIDIEESKQTIDNFFALYPGIKSYHERIIAGVQETRILRSPLGRKWFIPAINSEDYHDRSEAERFCMNYGIQSASSDTALLAAAEMNRKQVLPKDECFLALFVHDSLLFECLESKVEHYAKIIKHFMENPPLHKFDIKFSVPMVADIKAGPNRKDMETLSLT